MSDLNNIKIIFEDNHLLVVEKPPDMLSQSDSTGDRDLLSILKADLKQRYNKPGEAYLGLVHRLDRPVGGVMIFAKTSKSASRLSEQIRNGSFKKTYYAVIHGVPDTRNGTLEHHLLKDEETNTVSVVSATSGKGKFAKLDYEVVDSINDLSLVKINLHTGRSHQIRVQFSAIGHPLYGDRKYGTTNEKDESQIALWSTNIVITHPTTREQMSFSSPPPFIHPWRMFTRSEYSQL